MRTGALVLALGLAGCSQQPESTTRRERAPQPVPQVPREPDQQPRLVLAVVIDQLPSWWLDERFDALPDDGAIKKLAARGAFHRRVVYEHASTFTAPGHAAIFSGAVPRESGVISNRHWIEGRGRVEVVDDGEHPVHGKPGDHASPAVMEAPTVADQLKEATGGRGKVVSLSIKDRGAVLPAGKNPDLALWYESALPGFTTSTYYAEERPAWLVEWEQKHPVSERLTMWELEDPAWVARHLGPDDEPGEAEFHGLGTTFPHDLAGAAEPYKALRATPQAAQMLFEVALEAVDQLELGKDSQTDLLIVSISSTDYAGHVFGPGSWEVHDGFVRTDRALGRFIDALEERWPVSVLLTSDHGVAPMPERLRGKSGGRLFADEVAVGLDAHLDAALGDRAEWVADYVPPVIYLTPHAEQADRLPGVLAAAMQYLRGIEGIREAYDTRTVRERTDDPDDVVRAVAASIPTSNAGDIYVVQEPNWTVHPDRGEGEGTKHGAPYPYDREVPAIVVAPGVRPGVHAEPVSQRRVAGTLATLLGLPPPGYADATPLAGLAPVQPMSSSAIRGR